MPPIKVELPSGTWEELTDANDQYLTDDDIKKVEAVKKRRAEEAANVLSIEEKQKSPETTSSPLEFLPGYTFLNSRQKEILTHIHQNNPDIIENITTEYITVNLPQL
ncbi:MAG: hypothetical protein H6766_06780 [Candidatus Peribacteria bacterium]|nr:MAG: hypothetical protein H6766_06780 [Candidatus Peribacteria bacterium]